MIDYYTTKSLDGNARKVSIMMAETELEHDVYYVDLDKEEQYEPWFQTINPGGRIPAIVDQDVPGGLALGESGAILIYLAEKAGRLLPSSGPARARVLQWVFWQASGLGPMSGQWSYFWNKAPQKLDFAIARYRDECARLLKVLEQRLADHEYVAGDYSIADIMLFTFVEPVHRALLAFKEPPWAADFKHIPRWNDAIRARPAVQIATTRPEGTARRVARDI
jgi:glutathione S-transferase